MRHEETPIGKFKKGENFNSMENVEGMIDHEDNHNQKLKIHSIPLENNQNREVATNLTYLNQT